MKTQKSLNIVLILLVCLSSFIYGQTGSVGTSDGRSTALAGTYTTLTKGIFSIGKNPANLNLIDNKRFELVTEPSLNILLGTDFLTIDEFNFFFGGEKDNSGKTVGRNLTTSDKERLRNLFEGGGLIHTEISSQLFALAYKPSDKAGTFSFSIFDVFSGYINFPDEIINLVFSGNTLNYVYNFNNADMKSWWLRKYTLSYARDLYKDSVKFFKRISFGMSLNIVSGFMYAGIDKINSYIVSESTPEGIQIRGVGSMVGYSAFSKDFGVKYDFVDAPKSKSNVGLFPSAAGSGFGFDFGFTAKLSEIWTVGFSFTDIGKVTWDKEAVEFSSSSSFILDDITNKEKRDSLVDNLTGKGKFIDKFTTSLPTAFHFGLLYNLGAATKGYFPRSFLISLDLNQGFNDLPGNSKKTRISLGLEWKPDNWIPYLRTGFTFGGLTGFGWAAGLGIDFGLVEINGGTQVFHNLFMPNGAKTVSFAGDMKWKF